WQSDDPHTPAVLVKTTEPVTIENSVIRSKGDGIDSGVSHTNITVKNVQAYGLNPNVYGRAPGRFIDVENFDAITVQDSYLENTAGIYLLSYAGNHTTASTIKIVDNKAKNIDGTNTDDPWDGQNFNASNN